ncbi:MAG: radical SAM protein [Myxococcota bacterium]
MRTRDHRFPVGIRSVALPVTFTPYASAQPCSARCRFCSETLVRAGLTPRLSAVLRPAEDYPEMLTRVLAALRGLPMGLSLSGLEATDDVEWLTRALEVLDRHPFEERVLYSNAYGLYGDLADRVVASHFDRLEISRHSADPERNQRIMRFKAPRDFEASVRSLVQRVPIRLVCVLQRGGVEDGRTLRRYLDWARLTLGVSDIVFRELAQIDGLFRPNATERYIKSHRVAVEDLLVETAGWNDLLPVERTEGYYFWNVRARVGEALVTFEASDYRQMRARHQEDRVHKLVLHADGNLTADWDPDTRVLGRFGPAHLTRSPERRCAG